PGTATAKEIAQAVKLHGEIMTLAGAEPQEASEIDRSQLSFHLVGTLPLDLDFKQTLLGMKSEAERIQAVVSYFEAILPTYDGRCMCARRPEATGTPTEQFPSLQWRQGHPRPFTECM